MTLTPLAEPPYYAVIFASIEGSDLEGYKELAAKMGELAESMPGYLGADSAKADIGITVSYWRTAEDIRRWRMHSDHLLAQKLGKAKFYQCFTTRVAKVEREYDFSALP